MPIWLERFVLAVCGTAFIAIVLLNTMKFDWTQRITLGVAILAFSYFVAHTLYEQHNVQSPQQAPANLPSPPAQTPAENAVKESPRREEKPENRQPKKPHAEPEPQFESVQKSIEKITFVQEKIASPRPDLPHGLSVTVQTNIAISPVHLLFECSGPIGDARVSFAGPVSAMMGVVTAIDGNKFEFSIQNPPFTPRSPLVVTLFSATPISVLWVTHVY